MQRFTRRPVSLAAAAFGCTLCVVLGGCATTGSTFIAGRYGPDDQIVIKNVTIDGGRVELAYSMQLRVISSARNASLVCRMVDTSGRFGRLEQTASIAPADATWSTLAFSARYSLSDVTIGIRCTPSLKADYSITVRALTFTATPAPD